MNYFKHDKLSIKELKGKILKSITYEEFHLVEKIHCRLYMESFDLTKQRYLRKFDELGSKNKVTESATKHHYLNR